MRVLVFFLVFLNLLFFAYARGYLGHPDNPDALRLSQQVAPDTIKVAARGDAPPLTKEAVAAPSSAASTQPAVAPANVAAVAGNAETSCRLWKKLTDKEAGRLEKAAKGIVGLTLARKANEGAPSSWWVFIPPLADKPAVDKKQDELRNLGVADFFPVSESGPNRNAISLGVFSSEDAARKRLAELLAQGVRSAKVGVRDREAVPSFNVEAKGGDTTLAALLKTVGTGIVQPEICR
jgi:hypothetical protein